MQKKRLTYVRQCQYLEKEVRDEHCFVVETLFLSFFRLKPQFLKPKQYIQVPKIMVFGLDEQ